MKKLVQLSLSALEIALWLQKTISFSWFILPEIFELPMATSTVCFS